MSLYTIRFRLTNTSGPRQLGPSKTEPKCLGCNVYWALSVRKPKPKVKRAVVCMFGSEVSGFSQLHFGLYFASTLVAT